MKEKNKKDGLGCDRLPPYPAGAVFPVAQRCNRHRSFGLSIHWCNMLWPCFVLYTSVPSRMGGMGAQIRVERGLGGIVAVTPDAVEVWMSGGGMTRVMLGQARGSHVPVHCARSRLSHQREWVPQLGAPVAPHLARGLHVSLGRGRSMLRGRVLPCLRCRVR
jgi:hypothetical protein